MGNLLKALFEHFKYDEQNVADCCNISIEKIKYYADHADVKIPTGEAKIMADYFGVDYRLVLDMDFEKNPRAVVHSSIIEDIQTMREDGNYGTAKVLEYIHYKGYYTCEVKEDPKLTAFIAMSFDFENPKLCAIRDTFKQAICSTGFDPVIVNEIQSNNYITEDIINAINCCTFLVLDTTYENFGAYYEAGYAKGLKKEVIICCEKDKYEKYSDHFDISPIRHVLWSDFEELKKELDKRIHATVLKDCPDVEETEDELFEDVAAMTAQDRSKKCEMDATHDEVARYAKRRKE